MRVAARLTRAGDGFVMWSETYDREVKDIFAVQSEIAQAVAAQLKIKLLGEKLASDSIPFTAAVRRTLAPLDGFLR